ncbi:MAG TPA: hypothetical protein VFW68_12325 [Rhodocyclaceae bacterium]|nr:hypothetical protein [Rhodocyclaceae bacterium]
MAKRQDDGIGRLIQAGFMDGHDAVVGARQTGDQTPQPNAHTAGEYADFHLRWKVRKTIGTPP